MAVSVWGESTAVQECFGPHEYVILVEGRVALRSSRLLTLYEALTRTKTSAAA